MLRVGIKVRIVGCENPRMKHHVGKEGVIYRETFTVGKRYYVDGASAAINGIECCWSGEHLEPLTPPHEACDPEFAESIRRLTDSVSA